MTSAGGWRWLTVLVVLLLSGPALASCCGGGDGFLEERVRHAHLALSVQGLSVAVSLLGLGLALRGRRWWLALAWVVLLGGAPALAVGSADDCVSVLLSMYSVQLAFLLILSFEPAGSRSHRSQALLVGASAAAAIADWSLVEFKAYYWTGYYQGWVLLLVPAWAAWCWFWSWLLARPLIRGARSWRDLGLVERRVLVVGLAGAVPLSCAIGVVSTTILIRAWGELIWAGPAVFRFLLTSS